MLFNVLPTILEISECAKSRIVAQGFVAYLAVSVGQDVVAMATSAVPERAYRECLQTLTERHSYLGFSSGGDPPTQRLKK